jgi:signal recognition particle GTPase
MVLENLGNALRNTIKRVMNAPHIELQADVNVKQVLEPTKRIETRALTEKLRDCPKI